MDELRRCPRCDLTKPASQFYAKPDGKPMSYCASCYNGIQVTARKAPHRRPKVNAYNNAWQRAHREGNRDNVARWRAKQRALREQGPPWPPEGHMLISELQELLGCTRQWANHLI